MRSETRDLSEALGATRPRRRSVGLTPLIDVVFLLLVFFMLATRFDVDRALALDLEDPRAAIVSDSTSAARVEIAPDGGLRLDGRALAGVRALQRALAARVERDPELRVAVSPEAATPLQPIADALLAVRASGASRASLVRDRTLAPSPGEKPR